MDELVEFTEEPQGSGGILIAGWRQWADAGEISSGLPRYLVERTDAREIGRIRADGFYFFQVPGAHHFLRPRIKLEDGFPLSLSRHENLFYAAEAATEGAAGFYLFLGDEPHLNIDRYADAFFDAARRLGVRRIVGLGGVYGSIPYDKERDVSCTYSVRAMKEELSDYSLRMSNYEGGATIGSVLVHRAAQEGMEYLGLYGFVPAYDFSRPDMQAPGIQVETDFKAWYEIMRRFNRMFGLGLDLSHLEGLSDELVIALDEKMAELDRQMPELHVREYLDKLADGFEETPFMPVDDIWKQALDDLFQDPDE